MEILDPQLEEEKRLKKEQKKLEKKAKKEAELRIAQAKAEELEIKRNKALAKQASEDLNADGMFGTSSEPRKSLSTYLRNQNKLEVNLVAILDRKAAILIRIATTMISALIVFHGYIDENVRNGHMLSQILIIGLMVSLVLAILSTKPFGAAVRRMYQREIQPTHPTIEENNFLLFNVCSLEEYEESMIKVVNSQNLQLGNQIRANYILAKNNMYKAKMLDIAYNFFLLTFLIVGIVFSTGNIHFAL